MARHRLFIFIALFLLLPLSAGAQSLQPIPDLAARVTDVTGTLSDPEKAALEDKLARFEAEKGSQIAVLIVPTTEPEAIEAYSMRVAEKWKIGRQHVDDGVILVIAKNDHRMRIEVGYGLEGAIPDEKAHRIIDETLRPAFRAGNFYGGIDAATDQLIGLIRGENLPPAKNRVLSSRDAGNYIFIIVIIVFYFSEFLAQQLGQRNAAVICAVLSGFFSWLATRALAAAFFVGGFMALFFLMRSGRPFWISSGGWGTSPGGFSGGGFSGGGFSGGGGGFGGGGASGGW